MMELLLSENEKLAIEDFVFEKIQNFKFPEATIIMNNDWIIEIVN